MTALERKKTVINDCFKYQSLTYRHKKQGEKGETSNQGQRQELNP